MKALALKSHLNMYLYGGYSQSRGHLQGNAQQLQAEIENGVAYKKTVYFLCMTTLCMTIISEAEFVLKPSIPKFVKNEILIPKYGHRYNSDVFTFCGGKKRVTVIDQLTARIKPL